MPTSIDGWMSNESPYFAPSETGLAVDGWLLIAEKPTSIVIKRGAANRPAQTVRIEYDTTSNNDLQAPSGSSAKLKAIVFGIQDHPTRADTDIRRDDRFVFNGQQFVVMSIVYQTGQIQANCEALT